MNSIARFPRAVVLLVALWSWACGTRSVSDSPSISLEQKLTRQFALYDSAREALARRAAEGGAAYSRRDWERLLRPAREYRMSDEDLGMLRADQRRRIEASARQSSDSSAIDMKIVRSRKLLREFARAIPKGALLHVHPNGSLHRETVEKLLAASNPALHPDELRSDLSQRDHALYKGELDFLNGYPDDVRFAELRPEDKSRLEALFFLPAGTHRFSRFQAVFGMMDLLRSNPGVDFWGIVYDDLAGSAESLGLRYVEFTKGFQPDSAEVALLREIARRAMRDHGVIYRWNFALPRGRPPEQNLTRLGELLALPEMGVVSGIDLLGHEEGYPALDAGQQIYGRLLALEKEGRAIPHRTIHAAGLGEIRNIRDAMIFGAERLGHASRIGDDPVALEYAARRAQAVEVNLVSNVRLGYNEDYATHPFLDMLRLGLRVSLSTDDEGILGTDIVNEYALAIAHTDVTYDELKRMTLNSVETSFLDAESRGRLVQQLRKEFDAFERDWNGKAGPAASALAADLGRGKAE